MVGLKMLKFREDISVLRVLFRARCISIHCLLSLALSRFVLASKYGTQSFFERSIQCGLAAVGGGGGGCCESQPIRCQPASDCLIQAV